MEAHSRTLAAFVLAILLILNSWPSGAQATRLLLNKAHSPPSSFASSSQALKGLPADKKEPQKRVDSSFRQIPPSRSNPTQNKFKPHGGKK